MAVDCDESDGVIAFELSGDKDFVAGPGFGVDCSPDLGVDGATAWGVVAGGCLALAEDAFVVEVDEADGDAGFEAGGCDESADVLFVWSVVAVGEVFGGFWVGDCDVGGGVDDDAVDDGL